MDIKSIVAIEKKNTSSVYLHKEGLFWKAYEISAFLFIQNIKQYAIKKRFYKNVSNDIVSLGFPENILSKILDKIDSTRITKHKKEIVIIGFNTAITNFEQWKT